MNNPWRDRTKLSDLRGMLVGVEKPRFRFVWNVIVTGGEAEAIKEAMKAVIRELRAGDTLWNHEIFGYSVHKPVTFEGRTSILVDVVQHREIEVATFTDMLEWVLDNTILEAVMEVPGVTAVEHSERIVRPPWTGSIKRS